MGPQPWATFPPFIEIPESAHLSVLTKLFGGPGIPVSCIKKIGSSLKLV